MKPVMIVTSLLCLVFTPLIVVMRGVGAGQPNNPLALIFTYPDGTVCEQPCLFGVRPGHTTYPEALKYLRAHPLLDNAKEATVITDNELGIGSGVFSSEEMRVAFTTANDGRVRYVVIDEQLPPKNLPNVWTPARFDKATLAQAVAILGTPEEVRLTRRFATYLMYRERGISLTLRSLHRDRLRWGDATIAVYMQNSPLREERPAANWMGFVQLARYTAAAGVTP